MWVAAPVPAVKPFPSAWVSSVDRGAAQRDLQAAPDSLPLGVQ